MTAVLERRESMSLWAKFCNWITSTEMIVNYGNLWALFCFFYYFAVHALFIESAVKIFNVFLYREKLEVTDVFYFFLHEYFLIFMSKYFCLIFIIMELYIINIVAPVPPFPGLIEEGYCCRSSVYNNRLHKSAGH